MSGLPPASPPPKSAALDRYASVSELPSPQKPDSSSPVRSPAAPAALAPAAAPAPAEESITSKILEMIGGIMSELAAKAIPADMVVQAIESGEAAIGAAISKMSPAQKTNFKQVLQRIVAIIEQQGGRRRKTHKSSKKHSHRTRRRA